MAAAIIYNSTQTYGFRVFSSTSISGTFVSQYVYSTSGAGTAYTSVPFANDWNLTSTSTTSASLAGNYNATGELMIANGQFTVDPTYAINYSGYYYGVTATNSYNYTTLISSTQSDGYRYVTFAWKVDPSLSASSNINISFSGNATVSGTTGYLVDSTGSTPMKVYFRFEDKTANLVSFTGSNYSTYWINANGNTPGVAASSQNYYVIPSDKIPYYSGTIITTSSNIKASLPFSSPLSSSNSVISGSNLYVYVRIGLPTTSSSTYLTNIQAYLS